MTNKTLPPETEDNGRYTKVPSDKLKFIMDRLVATEASRLASIETTTELIAQARQFGYDRKVMAALEGLTYNNKETIELGEKAHAYLLTRMYQDKPKMVMPGATPTVSAMPGL